MSSPRETVIVLHGLGRMSVSMAWMNRALRKTGYDTINRNYAFRKGAIADLANEVVGSRIEEAIEDGAERVHFVTHSLGGILVRYFAEHNPVPEHSRAVMIAPPNQGSELVNIFRDLPPLHWFCGPSFGQLGVDDDSVPNRLGPMQLETGVIAGDRNLFPGFARHFDGPSDGIVAVERTKVAGMKDWTIVPHGHTFIMNASETIHQTLHFLRDGQFDHNTPHSDSSS